MPRTFLVGLILILASDASTSAEFPLRDGQKVVVLGDSITQAGQYIVYLDAYLATRFPDRKVELINLGLSSETASGLSEPDHPFPRPDIHARLARALELARPDVVLVCYGMNDGIYSPPDPNRFRAYQEGISTVVETARKAGAKVVVGTPPPFDPVPIKARLQPIGSDNYGYKHPFDGYDDVLGGYSGWLISRQAEGWAVADIHGSTLSLVASIRGSDPNFTLAGDGIHPNTSGHWMIAQAYLKAWDAPADVDGAVIDAVSRTASAGKVEAIESEGGTLKFTWLTRIPMPTDPNWDRRVVARERISENWNRHRLTVNRLDQPRYALFEGDRNVGEATREQLASGVDLVGFPDLSTNRRASEILPMVVKRHAILDPSWLEAVGHGPPARPRTTSLDQAKAQAEPILEKIRSLASPVPITLKLVPETR